MVSDSVSVGYYLQCFAFGFIHIVEQKTDLVFRDLEEFRREKMRFWTRAGYAFDGKSYSVYPLIEISQLLTRF